MTFATGIWLFYFFFHFVSTTQRSQEGLLFHELFTNRNYSAFVRPVQNTSHAVDVRIDVALVQLVALDDRDQSMTTNIWVRQYWKNEYLTWNPDDFGGLKSLIVDKSFIWTPDIVLSNSAESRLNGQLDQHKTRIILQHDGQNIWFIPTIMISGCSIDIEFFPFDYQQCHLKFMSWTYLRHELNLVPTRETMDISSYLNSTEFELVDTKASRTEAIYKISKYPFVDVTYTALLKRQPAFYTFNTIVPSLALTFFALITFAHPVDIGERMGLAIECFLTISILMNMVSDSIPIDSNVTPLLMRFQIICMTAMTMTIFMNALCFNMIGTTPMPWWLHDLVFNKLGPYVIWKSCLHGLKTQGTCSTTAICEGLFAASFSKRLQDNDEDDAGEFGKKLTARTNENFVITLQGNFNSRCNQNQKKDSTKSNDKICKYNEDDIENINLLARKAIDEMEEDNEGEVWRCMSQAIDRVMLFIFIIAYVTINVILLLQVPKVNLK